MDPQPVVFSPATPSELLELVISRHRYPTTLIIGSSRQDFLDALIQDVRPPLHPQNEESTERLVGNENTHDIGQPPLLQASLIQVAVSRHIRIIFTPTVTHLRAFLTTFSAKDSKVVAPPTEGAAESTPPLIVYGFVNMHRDGSEWSAQGIGCSASALVEAAAHSGFRAAVIEPSRMGGEQDLQSLLAENIPLLSGSSLRGDQVWSGRTIQLRRVFDRWFVYELIEYSERAETTITGRE